MQYEVGISTVGPQHMAEKIVTVEATGRLAAELAAERIFRNEYAVRRVYTVFVRDENGVTL